MFLLNFIKIRHRYSQEDDNLLANKFFEPIKKYLLRIILVFYHKSHEKRT
jgi:hypothetical protein